MMDKLSIDKFRKILEANGNKYTDDQVLLLRDKLYGLAEIDYTEFKRRQREGNPIDNKVRPERNSKGKTEDRAYYQKQQSP